MEEDLIQIGAIRLEDAADLGPVTDCNASIRLALNVLDHPDSGFLVTRVPLLDGSGTVVYVAVRKARQIAHASRVRSQVETVVNDAIAKLFECFRDGDFGEGPLMAGPEMRDTRRLDEVYKTLPSPAFVNANDEPSLRPDERHAINECRYRDPPGMISSLYTYQRRTLSRMLKSELCPGRIREPEYLVMRESIRGKGKRYYLDSRRWIFRRHLDHYSLPKGGILCEQMGVGKTVICLALIVATKDQLSTTPASLNFAPAVTDYSLHNFPFPDPARMRLALASSGFPTPPSPAMIPSLSRLCCHAIASAREGNFEHPEVPPHIWGTSTAWDFRQHYFDFDTRPRARNYTQKTPRKVFLSTATLVLVPNMLLHQWASEVRKHVAEGTLSVLEVTGNKGKNPLPDVMELLKYDMILMSQERVSHENNESSNLMQIRWKRVIIDEGHIAQSRTTSTVDFASRLSIERKWIVTGTPTRHLLGLDADSTQSLNIPSAQRQSIDSQPTVGVVVPSPNSKKRKRRTPDAVSSSLASQRWSVEELEDLTRLGNLFCFLGTEPFATSRLKFSADVMKPLRTNQFGSVQRMQSLMRSLLIRHESKDIRAEMPLPPIEIRSQGLAFDRLGRITHNVLISLIVGNLITSQATDADYLLHPKNLGDLHQAISNLHLSCLWFTSQNTGFESAIEVLERSLKDKPYTPAEVSQLEQAVHHLKLAQDDPHWAHLMMTTVSVIFEVAGLPEEVFSAYSECRVRARQGGVACQAPASLVAADGLLRIRRSAFVRSSLEGIVADAMAFFRERRADDVLNDREAQDIHLHGAGSNRPTGDTQIKHAVKNAATAAKAAMRELGDDAVIVPQETLDHSPLPHTINVYARSSKVHWILEELVKHPEDKYLIFGDPWVLGYLTEAIDLIQVKSVYVGPNISLMDKQDALALFELPSYRVCLLDLKLAARGLNLTAANRVIFIEPVWKPDVEAQAIKRVHRMGQTKPVVVTKLFIKGTFEEDMINRGAIRPEDREDQFQMSRLIEKPRFVETEDPPPFAPIKVVMGPTTDSPASLDSPRLVTPASPSQSASTHIGTARSSKRTKIAFALPDGIV